MNDLMRIVACCCRMCMNRCANGLTYDCMWLAADPLTNKEGTHQRWSLLTETGKAEGMGSKYTSVLFAQCALPLLSNGTDNE